MQRTITQSLLIALVLLTAVGVFAVATDCGGPTHSGMMDCPDSVVHHLSVYALLLTAMSVSLYVFFVLLAKTGGAHTRYTLTRLRAAPAHQLLHRKEMLDIPEDAFRLLLAAGRLQRRTVPNTTR